MCKEIVLWKNMDTRAVFSKGQVLPGSHKMSAENLE